jgi:hypothetical protein
MHKKRYLFRREKPKPPIVKSHDSDRAVRFRPGNKVIQPLSSEDEIRAATVPRTPIRRFVSAMKRTSSAQTKHGKSLTAPAGQRTPKENKAHRTPGSEASTSAQIPIALLSTDLEMKATRSRRRIPTVRKALIWSGLIYIVLSNLLPLISALKRYIAQLPN